MTAFEDNSSLDVSEKNSMTITLNIHTKSHTVCGTCGAFWERVGPQTLREINIYERSFTSEPSIEKHQAKPAHVNTTVYLDVMENPVEYQKLLWNVSEEGKETKGICLWTYLSKHTEYSWLRRYAEVRRVTKNVCKLHTKRVRLNKVPHNMRRSICWIVLWGYIKG